MLLLTCFCLCVGDFVECCCLDCSKYKENCPPASKSKFLSSKGKEKSATSTKNDSEDTARFSFLTDEDCDKLKECYRPLNTNKSRKWALANFDEWKEVRAKVIKGFKRSGQQNSTKSPTQKQKHPLKGSDSQPDRESLTNTAIHCSFPAKIVIAQWRSV